MRAGKEHTPLANCYAWTQSKGYVIFVVWLQGKLDDASRGGAVISRRERGLWKISCTLVQGKFVCRTVRERERRPRGYDVEIQERERERVSRERCVSIGDCGGDGAGARLGAD